ncbi:lipopolysaccharide biosynthesis protein [Marinobacter maritimus]|uniref:lipopolysaccharide biosynthesis protein n=1 Tax=Marinobacter maritimus TaxID=277961 RepID=UPI0011A90AA8|nr:oligosaccharide flippase family protein [Marinobacter maritimus]
MRFRKITAFSIGPVGGAALGLITLPFLTWFFSAEDIGRFTMLQVSLGLSTSLFSLAMHQAYVREYHEVADRAALFKAAIFPSISILTVLVLLSLILPLSISKILFEVESVLLEALLFIGGYSVLIINFLAHVLRMEERGLAFSATQVSPKLFFIICISAIFILSIESSFQILIMMNTFAVFGSLCIFAFLTRKTWMAAISRPLNVGLIKKMLSFSLPLVAGGLAYWGLTTMDRFFLRALSGFEQLGVYAISVSLAAAVSVLSTIFSNLWHPTVYRWIKEGVEPARIQAVIENMFIVVAITWSLVGLLSWVVPYFLPPRYQAVEYLIVACVAMPLFYMLSETTVVGIGITRRTSFSMISSIAAALVNAVLNFLLIPKYGAAGAALATLFSFFVFFLIRTESSAWLWVSLPRMKMYFLITAYLFATATMVVTEARIKNFNAIWVGLILLTAFMYYSRLFQSFWFIKNYLSKEV